MAKLIDSLSEFTSVSLPGYPRLVIGEELTDIDLEALKAAVSNAWGDRIQVVEEQDLPTLPSVPATVVVEPPAPVLEAVAEPAAATEEAATPEVAPKAPSSNSSKKRSY